MKTGIDRTLLRMLLAGFTFLGLPVATSVQAYVDPNKAIDLRADALRISGGKVTQELRGAEWVPKVTVREGDTISLTCDVVKGFVTP